MRQPIKSQMGLHFDPPASDPERDGGYTVTTMYWLKMGGRPQYQEYIARGEFERAFLMESAFHHIGEAEHNIGAFEVSWLVQLAETITDFVRDTLETMDRVFEDKEE